MATLSRSRTAATAALLFALLIGVGSCSDDDDNGETPTDPDPDPTGTVEGEVTAAGVGVAGADLALSRSGATTQNRSTAANGGFSFEDVAVGAWTLTLTEPAGFELAAGQDASVVVTVEDGQTSTVAFLLEANEEPEPEPDASILATVEADGAAHAGATVGLFEVAGVSALESATTDADGEATFDVVAGEYDVELEVPNGFRLASGEEARRTVTAASGGQATVDFTLESDEQGNVQQVNATSSLTFSPAEVTISVGTTVRWTNDSGIFHTVTPDGHSEWEEAALADGSTFSHTFDTPGTYPYYCSPHLAQGMTGAITVE